ncbi:MAG: cytochrome c3 family protein [Nitrospirota bacterium]
MGPFAWIGFFLFLEGALLGFLAPEARAADLSREVTGCLQCHGKRGIVMTFGDGGRREAHVSAEDFRKSVHRELGCSGCHEGFGPGVHPRRSFRSERLFRTRTLRVCRRCHPAEELRKSPAHALLIAREKEAGEPVLCSDCHGAHGITVVAQGRKFESEEQYCMGCHDKDMSLAVGAQTVSLEVSLEDIHGSVHGNLSCSDCHFGFSAESHPERSFTSGRDFTIANSETCRRCHFDKYAKTLKSIHYVTLCEGKLGSPVCVDCHGSHAVRHAARDRVSSAWKCRGCHPKTFKTYARSVHGAALFNEQNTDVPVCMDCHQIHSVNKPEHEKVPDMCSNCHADPAVVKKYGLSTEVLKTYLSDFHGVTLSFYREQKGPSRPVAVCTDCHGYHDITSTTGPDANVLKERLVKSCRQCHSGATSDFPDAWLSHYVPSLSHAPGVYLVNLAFKIFLPVLVVGLVLQILLHLWRVVSNR